MKLQVAFELDETDLKHFELIMREARKAAANAAPEAIVNSARLLLTRTRDARIPDFVGQRLAKLEIMIKMLEDHEWRLPADDASKVLNALAYFCEPEDLIPDQVPGIGFLDDAIMIELVVAELRHEIEAYMDFCSFRESQLPIKNSKNGSGAVSRTAWLDKRRAELQSRMRLRRKS